MTSLQKMFYDDLFRVFDDFGGPSTNYRLTSNGTFPRVNIKELKDSDGQRSIVIEAALAGYDPKDISVYIDGHALVFEYDAKEEKEADSKYSEQYYVKEMTSASFKRKILLSDKLDLQNPEISYKNGVAEVRFCEDSQKKPKILKLT